MSFPNEPPADARSHRSAGGGFTLLEMMVIVAIVAGLALVAFTAGRSALTASHQARCLSNLRNIGGALHIYAADHDGEFPETSHTADLDSSWIYQLEGYLGDFDETRVCPEDPKRRQRLAAHGTSYVLNSYLFVPETDPFGQPLGPALNRVSAIPDPSRTLLAFVCSDRTGTGPGNDHTHSNQWTSWAAVCRDIAPDRFGGGRPDHTKGRSNYLYADGSVVSMRAGEVKQKIESGTNIALPPGLPVSP